MASLQTKDVKPAIEATVKSYLTSFIDARTQDEPSLVNRNVTADCKRSMLPSTLGGGFIMTNDQYLHVFTEGLKTGGMHRNTISDLIIDVEARKAAVTTLAELVFNNGEGLKLDFSWFLHFNEDGDKICKIIEFVDSDTFKGVKGREAELSGEAQKNA
ncbi:hypothetical protein H9Q69_010045 [Fusarium xylarioides]|uniref:SnoaL-like domain-containing protein n=1 Tax=Fusarium xylarioides TaxID=221167 RepID=A0A9P7I3T4_9HYPO|nr:hypothetical protein H9Q70_014474 [Fusarium xylarioides]KAG5767458.1 hypothetical protein H9Q73_014227 [Fusarium xylarioides]KAG5774207.1 hypothetical protein H9Q72_000275 [Fusarium xylarioides]KAG5790913.1 hypothetical protein H9Q69_010045 [Fusarium xylarioides]